MFKATKPQPEPDVAVPVCDEAERVFEWRLEALELAGYNAPQAIAIAATPDIDLHQAVELAEKCGTDLATRILT